MNPAAISVEFTDEFTEKIFTGKNLYINVYTPCIPNLVSLIYLFGLKLIFSSNSCFMYIFMIFVV